MIVQGGQYLNVVDIGVSGFMKQLVMVLRAASFRTLLDLLGATRLLVVPLQTDCARLSSLKDVGFFVGVSIEELLTTNEGARDVDEVAFANIGVFFSSLMCQSLSLMVGSRWSAAMEKKMSLPSQ